MNWTAKYGICALGLAHGLGTSASAQPAPVQMPVNDVETQLPAPGDNPLAIDFAEDPILNLSGQAADPAYFQQIVIASMRNSALRKEAEAGVNLAKAELDEAESGRLPTADVNISSFRTLAREFSDDPFNLLERSRPRRRTDAIATLEYNLFDWGAVEIAVISAKSRLEAAGYERDAALTGMVSEVVTTWYSVFAYETLVRISRGFVDAQSDIEVALERRIEQGVSAPAERARAASLRARGEIRLAQFERRLASARARFLELTGSQAPPLIARPPMPDPAVMSRDFVINAAGQVAEVQGAEALARAARLDVRNARASQAPRLTAQIDAGRYGVFEDREDFDVRASVNLSYRLFGGGGKARINQAEARAEAAQAAAVRIREENERDAAIAWADLQALERQLAALELAYKSARQTRGAVVRRFAALRGTLFDVAEAQSAYLDASTAYIEGLTELDATRYILLARTGRLLEQFDGNDE